MKRKYFTILLVDNNEEDHVFFREAVKGTIYIVSCISAFNVREALSVLDNIHIDLIVSDLDMPVTSGIGFLEYLKERAGVPPFVFWSASLPDAERFRKAGAAFSFKKPAKIEILTHLMETIITTQVMAEYDNLTRRL